MQRRAILLLDGQTPNHGVLFMLGELRQAIAINASGNDFECQIYGAAIDKLSQMLARDIETCVWSLSEDADDLYRAYAIDVAKKCHVAHISRLLDRMIVDGTWHVRLTACNCIRELRLHLFSSPPAELLEREPHELVRDSIALALSVIGSPDEVSMLTKAAEVEKGTDHEGSPVKSTILTAINCILMRQ